MTAAASHSLPAGPRYSIIPAAAGTDRRFRGSDLQILVLIGRHTDRNGWCRLNQRKLAMLLDLSRSTVNRSISRLCELGYLEIRQHFRADGGQAASSYRVRMDVDDALAAPAIDIEDGDDEGAEQAGGTLDVVGPPVANLHTPLCTQDAHPPVHSGCTPLTTPLSNDQKKAQRQKKADGPGSHEAQDLPQAGSGDPSDVREQDDEGAERVAEAGDGALDDETAAARSAAARKAAETRMLHKAVNSWPGGPAERQGPIEEAWASLSAEDKRTAFDRIPVYLRRAVADKRKPGRLARYLAECPWRALPAPKPVREAAVRPYRPLPDEAIRGFLRSSAAREVLALAARDGLVSAVAQEIGRRHGHVSLDEYRQLRGGWMDDRDSGRRRAEEADGPLGISLRKMLAAREVVAARWQDFARDVLEGTGPPGAASEAAE